MFNKNPFQKQESAKIITPNNSFNLNKQDIIKKQMYEARYGRSVDNELPTNNGTTDFNNKMAALRNFNRNNQ